MVYNTMHVIQVIQIKGQNNKGSIKEKNNKRKQNKTHHYLD